MPNVVFPTAIEQIDGVRYVFYGMADSQIGVARLDHLTDRNHDPHASATPSALLSWHCRLLAGGRARRRRRRVRRSAADQLRPPELPGHDGDAAGTSPVTPHTGGRSRPLGVPWTYADRREDGHYDLIGGGGVRAGDGIWGQGAFNADDVTRAAVVYLRHWQQTGEDASRAKAFDLLRAVAYFQTLPGPNAGNVVLWMQPDGELNPSPGPSSCPTRRTATSRTGWPAPSGRWARGTPPSVDADPDVRGVPQGPARPGRRGAAASGAVAYGSRNVDGEQTPAWLVVDGADATAEAVLGLSAYVRTGVGDPAAHGRAAAARRRRRRDGSAATRAAGRSARCCRGRCRARSGTAGARRCRRRSPGLGGAGRRLAGRRSPPGTPRSSTR